MNKSTNTTRKTTLVKTGIDRSQPVQGYTSRQPVPAPYPRSVPFTPVTRGTAGEYVPRLINLESRGQFTGYNRAFQPRPTPPPISSSLIPTPPKKKLVLLLPAHNEELILAATIRSATRAGQDIQDIYVVDDASSDRTREIAIEHLGQDHVLTVKKSGKALAVQQAIEHFHLIQNYTWLHIADADSIFSADYFHQYRKKLDDKKYVVAVGFVQSMKGNWISTYRALTYTYSQHVTRRIQSYLNMISVFPGPITCFRTDVLEKLDFGADTLTEDFDITLQIHRKKLGKIVFIPNAVNFTQDPQTLRDFCKQTLRWQRGFFQGVRKYHIGINPHTIDASLGLSMYQTILFLLQAFLLIPLTIWATGSWNILLFIVAADLILNGIIAIFASFITKRWNLLGALPYFYFLRWVEIAIYVQAFVEIMILRRFRTSTRGWETEGRRYELSSAVLQEAAR